jgi:acyl-CoA thioesterase I
MRRALVLCLGSLLWLHPAASQEAGAGTAPSAVDGLPATQCPSASGFTASDEKLEALAAAIRSGGPINVLALGSATTVSEDGRTSTVTFPYHMIDTLHAALPQVDFELTVKGGRGQTAQDMLSALDAELAEHRFPLVLWQTGTVEAVRGLRPDSMHAALDAGVQHVRARGGDTVLIDAIYSRALRANTEFDPYEQVMRQVADLPGVVLFQRYDLTRSWVEKGLLDVEKAAKPDRAMEMDTLHACVGRALAAFVLNGVRRAGGPAATPDATPGAKP